MSLKRKILALLRDINDITKLSLIYHFIKGLK